MCQVGVRCYADSNSKLKAETRRLETVESKIDACKKDMNLAANENDFETYSKHRQTLTSLNEKRDKIVFERNSAQRDVDGTKKGQAIIEHEMMSAKSLKEFESLRLRKQQGEATAFVRAYSAKHRGKASPLFLPGDKKPARRAA